VYGYAMLKITEVEDETRITLVLEGKLADPWLPEFERTWADAKRGGWSKVIVNMKDVIAISDRAHALLNDMAREGVKFICPRGVFTKHVVKLLGGRCGSREKKSEK
jgi:hypothetical protein